jgi:8-oxo-dGTP pyrophosphatase MutT (NUDIX family)
MFIVRVYGILIENDRLLVTDEYRLGMLMTKFPGGGLEHGEGTIECLMREWKEETGFEIEVMSHYYTTDFYQPAFHLPEPGQVINIYYQVRASQPFQLNISRKQFDFPELKDGAQIFRWLDLRTLSPGDLTLPVDKVLAEKLIRDYVSGYFTEKPG